MGNRNKLNSRLGFLSLTLIMIGGFTLIFGEEFEVNISNAQQSELESGEAAEIISEIRLLLDQTLIEYQSENFTGSSALADEAYFENYEFIQAPLALVDANLSEDIAIMLRGPLRDQVTGTDLDADVPRIITGINSNLDKASEILTNKSENN